jgi:plastocyanin
MTRPTKLAGLSVLGLAAVLGLGACGGGGEGGDETAEQGGVAAEPDGAALHVEADEFSFSPNDLAAAAGTVAIEYVNVGAIPHTLLIEGVDALKLSVQNEGDVDAGSVRLEPGRYTLYCDVAGHRASGMEGTLTVS